MSVLRNADWIYSSSSYYYLVLLLLQYLSRQPWSLVFSFHHLNKIIIRERLSPRDVFHNNTTTPLPSYPRLACSYSTSDLYLSTPVSQKNDSSQLVATSGTLLHYLSPFRPLLNSSSPRLSRSDQTRPPYSWPCSLLRFQTTHRRKPAFILFLFFCLYQSTILAFPPDTSCKIIWYVHVPHNLSPPTSASHSKSKHRVLLALAERKIIAARLTAPLCKSPPCLRHK